MPLSRRQTLAGALGASAWAAGCAADRPARAAPAPAAPDDARRWRAVAETLDGLVVSGATPGLAALIGAGDETLFDRRFGAIDVTAPLPVASATKWLTGAMVMKGVENAELDLDMPVAASLPGFEGAARAITLRQLMSFTAGQGSLLDRFDLTLDPRQSFAQAAAAIAARPLTDPPGAVFRYGGPSFQIAGALLERATNRPWSALFAERFAAPLGMTQTVWTNPARADVQAADMRSPLLQGGCLTTAQDLFAFVRMLAQRGRAGATAVLEPQTVAAMEEAQTLGLPKLFFPPGMPGDAEYAIGCWSERRDAAGRTDLVSSPGALGTYPWIDRRAGLYGVFFMRARLRDVADTLRRARARAAGEA